MRRASGLRVLAFAAGIAFFAGVASPASADDAAAKDRAFVEVVVAREVVYVGEVVLLRLRVGFDGAWFPSHAIPLFRQRLDVPVQVDASFLQGLSGTSALGDAPAVSESTANGTMTFALGDTRASGARVGDESRGGRSFTVLEVTRRVVIDRAGDLPVAAPTLRFAHTSRFDEGALGGRVPTDREDAVVVGRALVLHAIDLPADGRPPGFRGAIGRFSITADADRREVAVGDALHVATMIEGAGNLGLFGPPAIDERKGFRVVGASDDRGATLRTIGYELAPMRADLTEIPPIEMAFFDPEPPAAYRVVRSAAIPIVVHEKPVGSAPTARGDESPEALRFVLWIFAAGFALLLLVGLFVFWIVDAVRRANRRLAVAPPSGPLDPSLRSALDAANQFKERALAPSADLSDAFARFLSAHLGCSPSAVVAPDLAARLERAGVSRPLAERASATLESLVASRYGGSEAPSVEYVLSLVVELQGPLLASRRAFTEGDHNGRPNGSPR